jgi:hypothetical protein
MDSTPSLNASIREELRERDIRRIVPCGRIEHKVFHDIHRWPTSTHAERWSFVSNSPDHPAGVKLGCEEHV